MVIFRLFSTIYNIMPIILSIQIHSFNSTLCNKCMFVNLGKNIITYTHTYIRYINIIHSAMAINWINHITYAYDQDRVKKMKYIKSANIFRYCVISCGLGRNTCIAEANISRSLRYATENRMNLRGTTFGNFVVTQYCWVQCIKYVIKRGVITSYNDSQGDQV